MKIFQKNTALCLFVMVLGAAGYFYLTQNDKPDYSETQWRTFYGEKPVDYRPEFWVTYYGSEDKSACYKSGVISVVDGKSKVKKEIYQEFIAEETNNGKNYVIRYPDKFKQNGCVYSSGGGEIYIEEKSDDSRLAQDPYDNKTQVYRLAVIYSTRVTSISVRSDSSEEEFRQGPMYINRPQYNIFCRRVRGKDEFNIENSGGFWRWLFCSSSSIEDGVEKYMADNMPFVSYTQSFWKIHPNIEVNFKISKMEYCRTGDSYCENFDFPSFNKNVLEPENFEEFYKTGDL
ncbi:hypothetical protein [Lonepinella sp. MS14437]|uniref:hypothetical protein n=1 Tax=Lonepinella sp. MS14437 TaxID=3003620 RepID=UPI0036D7B365